MYRRVRNPFCSSCFLSLSLALYIFIQCIRSVVVFIAHVENSYRDIRYVYIRPSICDGRYSNSKGTITVLLLKNEYPPKQAVKLSVTKIIRTFAGYAWACVYSIDPTGVINQDVRISVAIAFW